MGTLIGSAVAPVAFALTWPGCTSAAAVAACWGGLAAAITAWCSTAAAIGGGRVDVESLGADGAMLAGCVTALLASPAIAVAVSLRAPQRCDWARLRAATDADIVRDDLPPSCPAAAAGDGDGVAPTPSTSASDFDSGGDSGGGAAAKDGDAGLLGLDEEGMDSPEALDRVLHFSYRFGGGLTCLLVVAWPILTLPEVCALRCTRETQRPILVP